MVFIEYKKTYITLNITEASIDALRCSSASIFKLSMFKYMKLLCQKLTNLGNTYCKFNTLNEYCSEFSVSKKY